jgi:hypothetical protein
MVYLRYFNSLLLFSASGDERQNGSVRQLYGTFAILSGP